MQNDYSIMDTQSLKFTKPKPTGHREVPKERLVAWRYGTKEMTPLWGAEATYEGILNAQATATEIISRFYPEKISLEEAQAIRRAAKMDVNSTDRMSYLEEKLGHDVMGANTYLEEKVVKINPAAASHVSLARTSADSTETAKPLQIKKSLIVYADTLENLRDIILEKSMAWKDIPHMDQTHLYDALPTVLGRPLAFYGETLQSDLNKIAEIYRDSLMAKWSDATGNYHSAEAVDMDGIKLEEEYCKALGLKHMDASAQIPAREYLSDVIYVLARTAETMGNLAHYIRMGRGDDAGIFRFPRKKKGSTTMPHKDAKGGNPTVEEQTESYVNYMRGIMPTSLSSCRFDYGRDLSGSASDRIIFETAFNWGDFVARRLADVVHKLEPVEERCKERVTRSYGAPTAQWVMTYVTDKTKTANPMPRSEAHDLIAKLATDAYDSKTQFRDIVLACSDITSRLDRDTIIRITDPTNYIGRSKDIIDGVYSKYHGNKTLEI